MRSTLIRRGVAAFAVLAVLAVAALAALPFIASTQIVKDRLALELSRWSGYRVSLGSDPVIAVWPSMRASLGNVKLSEWGSAGGPAVISSETVEIDLSALDALGGHITPRKVRFVRPVLRLRGDGTAYSLPPATGGRLGQAVRIAGGLLAADPAKPDLAGLPGDPVGTIEFVDGRIVENRADGSPDRELVTSLSGSLQWPAMNRDLAFSMEAIWRGENIVVRGTLGAPLIVLAGGSAPVRFALESAPLTASFAGTADLTRPVYLAGDIALSSPSLGRALDWSGAGFGAELPVGAASLAGKLSGQAQKMKIDKAEMSLGGNPGKGTLELALDGPVPAVSGTLAFDKLDLVDVLAAYSVIPLASQPAGQPIASTLIDSLSLDLRLSAATATAGPIGLSEVAAAIQVKDRLLTFDISDSKAFGGSVLTGIRIDRKTGRDAGEFRLLADDIDGAALSAATGLDPLMPKARGKVSVILKGPLAAPERFLATASGSITASFGAGSIGDIDLDAFLERSRSGGFFSLDAVAGGALAFDRAELKATVTDGVATIEKVRALAGAHRIELAGIAAYAERSLALTGTVGPSAEGASEPPVAFFVGGSWESPYISAVLPNPPAD
jgi:AsmA protein